MFAGLLEVNELLLIMSAVAYSMSSIQSHSKGVSSLRGSAN